MNGNESVWSETAAWVEAIGAIAAVIGAGWVAASESRATRRREERAEASALRREAKLDLATRTAALNLAILAATQINDLHVQLKDEAWRWRVTRVSASRALLATERMLTAFPKYLETRPPWWLFRTFQPPWPSPQRSTSTLKQRYGRRSNLIAVSFSIITTCR